MERKGCTALRVFKADIY